MSITPRLLARSLTRNLAWICWAISACAASSGAALANPDGVWSTISVPERFAQFAFFDRPNDRMIVFGGTDGARSSTDVWAFALGATPSWERLDVLGAPPSLSGSNLSAPIYDSRRNRILLWRGQPDSIWVLSLSGAPEWSVLTPMGVLPHDRRTPTAAAYDSLGDAMLTFGGYDPAAPSVFFPYTDELWKLSLTGAPSWSLLGSGGPAKRHTPLGAFDPTRREFIIQGGSNSHNYPGGQTFFFHDVWRYSIATGVWRDATPSVSPYGGVTASAISFDATHDRLVELADPDTALWLLDSAPGSEWESRTITGARPTTPEFSSVLFDWDRDRLLFDALDGIWSASLSAPSNWQLANPPTAPTPPSLDHTTSIVQIDPHRMLQLRNGSDSTSVWSLSLDDPPRWSVATPGGVPLYLSLRSDVASVYDQHRDRAITTADGGLFALDLSGPFDWTQIGGIAPVPNVNTHSSVIYDAARDRLVFSIWSLDAQSRGRNDVWALPLDGGPASHIAESIPRPNIRGTPRAVYDPIDDRLVVVAEVYFYDGTTPFDTLQVWALPLVDSTGWVRLSADLPSNTDDVVPVFHTPSDRILIMGRQPGTNLEGTWALPAHDGGSWTLLDTPGGGPGKREDQSLVYDASTDRMIAYGGGSFPTADTWFLDFGGDVPGIVHCPDDVRWTQAGVEPLRFGLRNPGSVAHTYVYTLSSDRDWPGLPAIDSVTVAGGAVDSIAIGVPLPDSATLGPVRLSFRVGRSDQPRLQASCFAIFRREIVLSAGLLSMDADSSSVRLRWYVHGGSAPTATLDRAPGDHPFERIATLTPAEGVLAYDDASVAPGGRYRYQLVVHDAQGDLTLDPVTVDVPGGPVPPRPASLALLGPAPNPAGADLDVAFALPDASPATLELIDLGGRLLLRRSVGELGPGAHSLALGRGQVIRPGVYLVRLTASGRTLTKRAVLLR